MPKRNRNRSKRSKKGGFLGFGEGTVEAPADGSAPKKGYMDSLGSMFSSAPAAEPAPAPAPVPANNSYETNQTPTEGGRRRRRRMRKSRRMRGGYSDNVSMTNLASRAAPFSGETARPQAYVGGRRTKRRCHTHKRSRRRHCRK
jgi:hypothetical protein